MRLIGTIDTLQQGQAFSAFLFSQGIQHECEFVKNQDWGSANYGNISCNIWVLEEDEALRALELLQDFQENPADPKFAARKGYPLPPKMGLSPTSQEKKQPPLKMIKLRRAPFLWTREPVGRITLYVMLICAWLFIWGEMTAPPMKRVPPSMPYPPFLTAPIKKKLLFDYPRAYEYVDKLILLYGAERVKTPNTLPPEGKYMLEQYYQTPYWQGLYSLILTHAFHPEMEWQRSTPLFEKIRQGEWWRLFTPCLLHSDIFHILFNMMWLLVLGKQIENRLGIPRYLLFILITGVFSNVAQYLVAGANFIGFSGVLCAMLGFIWSRQNVAAWEGYQLQRATLAFLAFFIFAMFAIQVISFFLELYYQVSISPGIANTAHVSGAIIGAILGRWKLFAWKNP